MKPEDEWAAIERAISGPILTEEQVDGIRAFNGPIAESVMALMCDSHETLRRTVDQLIKLGSGLTDSLKECIRMNRNLQEENHHFAEIVKRFGDLIAGEALPSDLMAQLAGLKEMLLAHRESLPKEPQGG